MKKIQILLMLFVFLCQFSCHSSSSDEQTLNLPISSLTFIDQNEFWLITNKGKVIHHVNNIETKDGDNFIAPVEHIFFLNQNEGWILNRDCWILATTDGGKSWLKKYQFDSRDTGTSNGMVFSDNKTGWIWGGLGMWLTEDGGNSWTRLLSNEKISLGDLGGEPLTYFPVDSNIGWLGMTNGKILKTNESGKTWTSVSLPQQNYNSISERKPNVDVASLFCFDEKSCWAAIGTRGGLLLTTNGGKDWQAVLENKVKPNTAINSINFVTEKIGWSVGIEFILNTNETPNNVVLKTIDGGKTWNHINTEIDEPYFTKVKFIDEQNGWLVGKKTIYKTGDGGKIWRKIYQVN